MSRRLYPKKCRGLAADSCDRPRGLRTVALPPPVPRGRACTARIAPTCAVLPPLRQRGWALAGALTYVTAFWPAPGPLYPTRPLRLTSAANAPASVTRPHLRLSDRANVHRTPAPIGGAARCRPTFVTAKAPDTPYTQPGLCASRVPPARPRRCSACACAPGHAPIGRRCLVPLRRPDRSAPVKLPAPNFHSRRPACQTAVP